MQEVYDAGDQYKNPVLNVTFKGEEFEDTPEFVDYPEYVPFPSREPAVVNVSALTGGDDDGLEAEIEEAQKLVQKAQGRAERVS